MKRKWLATFMCALMLVACVPMGALSVAAGKQGDLTYVIENGKVTITDCGALAAGEGRAADDARHRQLHL